LYGGDSDIVDDGRSDVVKLLVRTYKADTDKVPEVTIIRGSAIWFILSPYNNA